MTDQQLPNDLLVPKPDGNYEIPIEAGSTVTFCGANGCGKTRLAVYLEEELSLNAHRISAHRALSLNPRVPKISEQEALANLRTGTTVRLNDSNRVRYRSGSRWNDQQAVLLLNDFNYLLQVLFAEQANTALDSHQQLRMSGSGAAKATKFEKLSAMWSQLLPDRELIISGDDIAVKKSTNDKEYEASELSDGERAIFYLIGQTLVAQENSVLIIDEPELHIHPAAIVSLWDELAASRPDCVFVFITHCLDFAASRPGQKFCIFEYDPAPTWILEPVPKDCGFSEDFTTRVLGSRKPILFVEGNNSTSLDRFIYRAVYPDHLIVPLESSTAVIHAVASMGANAEFTRVSCQGLVDRDSRTNEEIENLKTRDVYVLPVAEVENVFLLPEVADVIARIEGFEGEERTSLIESLHREMRKGCSEENIELVVLRIARRHINRHLRRLGLEKAKSIDELRSLYCKETSALAIDQYSQQIRAEIRSALAENNVVGFLAHYEDKSLFACAARILRKDNVKSFRDWLERVLTNNSQPQLTDTIRSVLPKIPIRKTTD
ncbi:MAG: AAA family ATPase [Gammaproteobacteria bacterium]|nr:AAA family ATPase [Gammaproteobacteria bacterium]